MDDLLKRKINLDSENKEIFFVPQARRTNERGCDAGRGPVFIAEMTRCSMGNVVHTVKRERFICLVDILGFSVIYSVIQDGWMYRLSEPSTNFAILISFRLKTISFCR